MYGASHLLQPPSRDKLAMLSSASGNVSISRLFSSFSMGGRE